MSDTFRQVDRKTLYLMPPSMNDWLPEGHLARFIIEIVGQLNLTAERILAAAREAGVHISEDPDLVELLARVPVGAPIPAELYQTVAQLLAFVYAVNARFKEKLGPMGNR